MSLEALAAEITKKTQQEAGAILDEAKAEAKRIEEEARSDATQTSSMATSKAERESEQISIELVASARQANQKRALIARREELELTWEAAKEEVSSPKLAGRKKILESLVKEASDTKADVVMRPVKTDRDALAKSGFKMGEDIDRAGRIRSRIQGRFNYAGLQI